MRNRASTRGAGFTLVELLIALALLALVVAKVTYLADSAFQYSRQTSSSMVLDEKAEILMDKIVYSLMGSDRDDLIPITESPLHASSLTYRISFGMENGEVVWGAPETIGLEDGRCLVWSETPDGAAARRVVWTNLVRPLLEGEQINGVDDNANGLIDETGLNFAIDGSTVVIRMTLTSESGEELAVTRTVEAAAACRNLLEKRNGIDIQYL